MMMGLGLWQEHSSLDGSLLCLALHLKFQTLLNKMQDACRYVNAFARNRSFWRCNHGWGYVSDASRIVDISQYTAWETVLVWHNVVRLTQSINRANDRPTNWSTSHSTGHKAILWRNVQHVVVTANECTDKPDSHSYSHSHSNKKQHAHLSIKTDDLGALSVAFSASPSLSLSSRLWWSVKYTIIYCQIVPAKIAQQTVRQPGHNNNRPWFMFTCPHFLRHSNKVVIRTTTATTTTMSAEATTAATDQTSCSCRPLSSIFIVILW